MSYLLCLMSYVLCLTNFYLIWIILLSCSIFSCKLSCKLSCRFSSRFCCWICCRCIIFFANYIGHIILTGNCCIYHLLIHHHAKGCSLKSFALPGSQSS